MKLRLSALFLALLILCAGITGCSREPVPQQTAGQTEPAQTAPPETVPPTQPPETVPPAPEDLFSRCGQGFLPAAASLPPYAQQTDTPHLYSCALPLEEPNSGSIQVSGDVIFICHWETSSLCDMYSLSDGSFIQRVDLMPVYGWGLLDIGALWTVEASRLQVTFYDSLGRSTEVFSLPEAPGQDRILSHCLVSRDGKYLAVTYDSGDILELYDLQTGILRSIPVPQTLNAWYLEECRDGFLVSDYGRCVYFLDTATGQLEYRPEWESGTLYSGIYHYYRDGALVFGSSAEEDPLLYLDCDPSELLLDLDFGCAVTQIYGEDTRLRFYDLRRERLVLECVLPEPYYSLSAELLSDGTALVACQSETGLKLYLWDLPALVAETEGTPISVLYATDSQLAEQTQLLAARIREETGVELFYGSTGNDFLIYDYVGVVQPEPYDVYHAVKEVDRILARYPQGMLREAYELTHKGLRIYLCGNIYGVQPTSVSSAGGVTSEWEGYLVVALDAGNNLAYDLPHELSHVFDRRIAQAETDWMILWDDATPFPDSYLYTYTDYPMYTAYTPDDGDGEVWFVDSYARTYPTEDRARIMEHMANRDRPFSQELFSHPHLQYKARLYAYILRQCFPSCQTGQELFWEQGLENIDQSVLYYPVG